MSEIVNPVILSFFVAIIPAMWFMVYFVMSEGPTKKKLKGGIGVGAFSAILAVTLFFVAVSGHKIGIILLIWGLMMPPLFIFIIAGLLYLLPLVIVVAKKINSRLGKA